jgi:hypothetical protein
VASDTVIEDAGGDAVLAAVVEEHYLETCLF